MAKMIISAVVLSYLFINLFCLIVVDFFFFLFCLFHLLHAVLVLKKKIISAGNLNELKSSFWFSFSDLIKHIGLL